MAIILTGQQDTDLFILDYLGDEDLLYTCLTNKYINNLCQDEGFWVRRFTKKFGKEAVASNPEEFTWMIYYYLYPYLPLSEDNFWEAVDDGSIPAIEYYFDNGYVKELEDAGNRATRFNYRLLLWFNETYGFLPDQEAIDDAAADGQIKTIEWLKEKGLKPTSEAVKGAAMNGDISTLEYLEKGEIFVTEDMVEYANNAADGNAVPVLEWFAKRGVLPDKRGVREAIIGHDHEEKESKDTIRWLRKKGLLTSQEYRDAIKEKSKVYFDSLLEVGILPPQDIGDNIMLTKTRDVIKDLLERGFKPSQKVIDELTKRADRYFLEDLYNMGFKPSQNLVDQMARRDWLFYNFLKSHDIYASKDK